MRLECVPIYIECSWKGAIHQGKEKSTTFFPDTGDIYQINFFLISQENIYIANDLRLSSNVPNPSYKENFSTLAPVTIPPKTYLYKVNVTKHYLI